MTAKASPGLMATLTGLVPARLVKKLDQNPSAAKAWAWDGLVVRTDTDETVTLAPVDGVVSAIEHVRCTCLLSPRCFHVLAVAAALELEGGDAPSEASEAVVAPVPRAPVPVETVTPTVGQRAAGRLALRVAEDLLRAGAAGAGAVLQSELLRLVHEARVEGAYRLSGAALRAVRGVRALRAEEPAFSTADLVADLEDLLFAAHHLEGSGAVPGTVVGVARRAYEPRGHLRLTGLLCEPVIARGGYAGVTSWVVDEKGNLFTISDILPAGPSRARGAYDVAIALGDTSIPHRALCREGLFVQDATASEDLRLGAGKAVKAVRASGATSWADAGPATRFAEPFAAQLARAFAALAVPEEQRARTATALFFEGTVIGHDGRALFVEVAGVGPLRLVSPDDHEELRYHENLRQLSRAAGKVVKVIGRLVPDARATVAALAVSAGPEILPVPDALSQRVNLGLDVLQAADVGGGRVTELTTAFESRALDPLHPLRRRLERLAIHGVRSLPTEAGPVVDSERAALERALLVRGSHVLGALYEGARASTRGEPRLARAFLTGVIYERTATRSLRQATFVARP